MRNWGKGNPRFNISKIADNPAAQNMPHEEDYSNNNYESINKTAYKLINNSTIVVNVVIVICCNSVSKPTCADVYKYYI